MIDNLEIIQPLLTFDNEDDFYFLQLIQRKKENPQLGSNSKVIKNYYISNYRYLLDHYHEIKKLCKLFNARAMIRLNKRSYQKVALKTIQNVANSIANGEYVFVKKSYDRACGQGHNDKVKKWIIDIDEILLNKEIKKLKNLVNVCAPMGIIKVISEIPSKNGIHLISIPFNIQELQLRMMGEPKFLNISIHKDNPTNLFIP